MRVVVASLVLSTCIAASCSGPKMGEEGACAFEFGDDFLKPSVAPPLANDSERRMYCTFEDVASTEVFKRAFSDTGSLHVAAIACDVGPFDGIEVRLVDARGKAPVGCSRKFFAHDRQVFLILDLNSSDHVDDAGVPSGALAVYQVIGKSAFRVETWKIASLQTKWMRENVGCSEWFPFGQLDVLRLDYPSSWDGKLEHRAPVAVTSTTFNKVIRWYPILYRSTEPTAEESAGALILDAEIEVLKGGDK